MVSVETFVPIVDFAINQEEPWPYPDPGEESDNDDDTTGH